MCLSVRLWQSVIHLIDEQGNSIPTTKQEVEVNTHSPYLSSQIWASCFFKVSQIFSAGLLNERGLVTEFTNLVADMSVAPI